MLDLSALMATDDFGREMRTRVALDTQGELELSVSYEVEDAHDPLLTSRYGRLPPLSAPYNLTLTLTLTLTLALTLTLTTSYRWRRSTTRWSCWSGARESSACTCTVAATSSQWTTRPTYRLHPLHSKPHVHVTGR